MVNRLVSYGRGVLLLGLVLLMAAASSGALHGLFRPAQTSPQAVNAASLQGNRSSAAEALFETNPFVRSVAAQDDNEDEDNDDSDDEDNESTSTTSNPDEDIVIENVAPAGGGAPASAPAPAASPTPTPAPAPAGPPPGGSDPEDVVIANVAS